MVTNEFEQMCLKWQWTDWKTHGTKAKNNSHYSPIRTGLNTFEWIPPKYFSVCNFELTDTTSTYTPAAHRRVPVVQLTTHKHAHTHLPTLVFTAQHNHCRCRYTKAKLFSPTWALNTHSSWTQSKRCDHVCVFVCECKPPSPNVKYGSSTIFVERTEPLNVSSLVTVEFASSFFYFRSCTI